MTVDELIAALRALPKEAKSREVWMRVSIMQKGEPVSVLDVLEDVRIDDDGDVLLVGES